MHTFAILKFSLFLLEIIRHPDPAAHDSPGLVHRLSGDKVTSMFEPSAQPLREARFIVFFAFHSDDGKQYDRLTKR